MMDHLGNGGIPLCMVCKKPANQNCGGCKRVFYCSRAHQKLDWRDGHKLNCCAFKVQYSEQLGRHIIATRDIREGEMILKEKPAMTSPKMNTFPCCLGCHKRLRASKLDNGKWDFMRCARCNWPMCGSKCQTAERHKEECDLMTKMNYKSAISADAGEKKEPAYCVIGPLRCLLLKDKDPQQYDNILSLESHLEERIDTPLYGVLKANLITFIIQVLGMQVDDETILKIAAIWDTNAFELKTSDSNFRGIYVTLAMMAHDCKPNTKHVFTASDQNMALIATVPIPKGTLITASYTQTLWGTLPRREHLKLTKCFDCSCQRCSDPTEFGLNLGSILCSICCSTFASDSLLKSTNPLDPAADWTCEQCGHTLKAKQMTCGNQAIKKEFESIDRTRPKKFEEFIEKYGRTVHSTNYHILQAKYVLTQLYGNAGGYELNDLEDKLIARKIELCNDLLEVANVLDPGLTRFRGVLLLDLQSAMLIQTKRDLASDRITKSAAEGLLLECMNMLNEANGILKVEPDMTTTLESRMRYLLKEIEENYEEANGEENGYVEADEVQQ